MLLFAQQIVIDINGTISVDSTALIAAGTAIGGGIVQVYRMATARRLAAETERQKRLDAAVARGDGFAENTFRLGVENAKTNIAQANAIERLHKIIDERLPAKSPEKEVEHGRL